MFKTFSTRIIVVPGTSLEELVREVIDFSRNMHCLVEFNFNGCELSASYNTTVEELIRQYRLYCKKISQNIKKEEY